MKRAVGNTRYHKCRNIHSSHYQNSGNQRSLKTCCFCGKRFTLEHKEKCAARNVNCSLCGKRSHFAKCCNSAKPQADNVISDEEDEKITNLTDSDSEPDNSVLRIKEVDNIGNSVKSLEVINAASFFLATYLKTGWNPNLSLPTKMKGKRFLQQNLHTNLKTICFKDFHNLCELLFRGEKLCWRINAII